MTRVANDACEIAAVIADAGEAPHAVIEATYGWYWAVDLLHELGATLHLANPKALNWGERRVKNDVIDAHGSCGHAHVVGCRRRGSRRRRSGSSANGCGTCRPTACRAPRRRCDPPRASTPSSTRRNSAIATLGRRVVALGVMVLPRREDTEMSRPGDVVLLPRLSYVVRSTTGLGEGRRREERIDFSFGDRVFPAPRDGDGLGVGRDRFVSCSARSDLRRVARRRRCSRRMRRRLRTVGSVGSRSGPTTTCGSRRRMGTGSRRRLWPG